MTGEVGRRCKGGDKNRFDPKTFNRLVVIQSLVQTQDTHGGMVDSWVYKTELLMRVNNLSPRYNNESAVTRHGGQAGEARTEFEGRFIAGITTLDRAVYDGKNYNITHVNNYYEQNRFLILTCSTGVNDGR